MAQREPFSSRDVLGCGFKEAATDQAVNILPANSSRAARQEAPPPTPDQK
jgi:hypothetical protein